MNALVFCILGICVCVSVEAQQMQPPPYPSADEADISEPTSGTEYGSGDLLHAESSHKATLPVFTTPPVGLYVWYNWHVKLACSGAGAFPEEHFGGGTLMQPPQTPIVVERSCSKTWVVQEEGPDYIYINATTEAHWTNTWGSRTDTKEEQRWVIITAPDRPSLPEDPAVFPDS